LKANYLHYPLEFWLCSVSIALSFLSPPFHPSPPRTRSSGFRCRPIGRRDLSPWLLRCVFQTPLKHYLPEEIRPVNYLVQVRDWSMGWPALHRPDVSFTDTFFPPPDQGDPSSSSFNCFGDSLIPPPPPSPPPQGFPFSLYRPVPACPLIFTVASYLYRYGCGAATDINGRP